jgi:hypothetical protein
MSLGRVARPPVTARETLAAERGKQPNREKGMRNDMRNGMSELPEELSGAELDAVTGGQANGNPIAAGGLVNVAVGPTNVDVLRGADIDVIDDVTLRDIANHNNVGVGALVQVLGGTAGVITGQTQ